MSSHKECYMLESFDFLSKTEEDIYSWEDGEVIEDSPLMPARNEYTVNLVVEAIERGEMGRLYGR